MNASARARSEGPRWRHPILSAVAVVLIPGLWVLFVGTSSRDEMIVGVAASAASIAFILFVAGSSRMEIALRPRDLIQIWRIPWYIISGVYEITVIFFRDLLHLAPAESLYRVCGLDSSTHDPVRKARTMLAVAYTTTAPNFIVIGVDASRSRMLFHQLEASTVPKMTKALGAKS